MVSNSVIYMLTFVAIFSLLFPIGLFIFFKLKDKISVKPVILGILTFIVFSQVLEKLMHVFVMNNNLITAPLLFAIYGALAAGVFEEVGRYIVMKLFMKKETEWKDGIAFGIGHGGIEAILLACFGNLTYIFYAKLINAGLFEKTLSGKAPAATIAAIKTSLISATPALTSLGAVERLFAIIAHLGFSLIVIYSVKSKKPIYLLIAIIAHAVMDFPAGLAQVHILNNIWFVEGFFAIFSIAMLIFIIKSKEIFKDLNT